MKNKRMVLYHVMTRLFGNTNSTNKPWGTLEENGVGKFDDFTSDALKQLSKSGYTHIWYTGVIEHGVLTDYEEAGIPLDDADVIKGRAGSPYAIKDYYDVNPDLSNDINNRVTEFESLLERSHHAGLKVLIDFVPNHVARSYHSDKNPGNFPDFGADDDLTKSFDPNNNFYYFPGQTFQVPAGYQTLGDCEFPTKTGHFDENPAKATGNDVFSPTPSVNDWFETVKLNYAVDYQDHRKTYFDPIPNTWLKMRHILLYWAAKGVDGFRCDMAEMVPVEFWAWVIKEVKAVYPKITFTAEIYIPDNYRNYIFTGGFDNLYDKVELYDTLKRIIQGHASTDDITRVWQSQEGISDHMLRFLENHDEQRIASPDFAGDMQKGIPMMAVTAFMHKGPVMMYFGQEVGEPGNGFSGFSSDDGRTTIFDYWGVPEHQKWMNHGKFDGAMLSAAQKDLKQRYEKLLQTTNLRESVREGAFFDLHYYNRNAQYQGYSNRIYAFIRHSENDQVLIIVNFAEESEEVAIKIPDMAWEKMNINTDTVVIGADAINRQSTVSFDTPSELKLTIPALDYHLIEIEKNL
ncbi:MAG: alpha-amylase family protein [Cytophagales bacterium]|nr:alpha-amylase family protein [Cytophagales bacterium]